MDCARPKAQSKVSQFINLDIIGLQRYDFLSIHTSTSEIFLSLFLHNAAAAVQLAQLGLSVF